MPDTRSDQPDPSMIGGIPKASFALLPDPKSIFSQRARRFRAIALRHHVAAYLEFLAAISNAQGAILPDLSPPELPSSEVLARARQFAMPPLDRVGFKPTAIFRNTCRNLFKEVANISKPDIAENALARVRSLDDQSLDRMTVTTLSTPTVEAAGEQIYLAAALQVYFAMLASQIDPLTLAPVAVGVCPVCGSRPSTSLVVGWQGAEGVRYASCMLCSALWNEVRVKCLACGSTKGIGYQEIEGQGGTIKAETCDECGSYIKILYQNKDAMLDPVADDVGTLGLDQMLRESAYHRAGSNPYLAGY
jgi:FdhE protein